MALKFLEQVKSIFEGDPGVRKVADDPVLTAELLLLVRMILADGEATDQEMATLRRICRDSFNIPEESMDGVIQYLNDFGYETNGAQAIDMFRELDLERRKSLARHMAEIAKSDERLDEGELKLMKRALDLLKLQPADLASAG
ncbi:MAG: TerB family tellurite resistance protein [Rhizobiaceae bacterium]|nr:TerB family tellurite resistance protein [Rhizobiaceae bacterium]